MSALRSGLARLSALLVLAGAGAAQAQSFGGALQYGGALGPVSAARPLCVCLYTDAALTRSIGCLIRPRNDTTYTANVGNRDYYAVAFLDVHKNDRQDADEPYEIFQNLAAAPAVAIRAADNPMNIDFAFGDENLAGASPTVTPTETPNGGAATPTQPAPDLAGDCNGDGAVTVNELVTAVSVALEAQSLSACIAADRDGDGAVRIDELIAALSAALDRD